MKVWLSLLMLCTILLTPSFADDHHAKSGVGFLAHKALEPIGLAYNIIGTTSFCIGILFLLASIIRYIDYRSNPLRTTLSTVFFLLISGLILAILPFLSMWMETGVPFFLVNFFSID